jgi:heterodisulfide reductase subunit A-like polyferredoxin
LISTRKYIPSGNNSEDRNIGENINTNVIVVGSGATGLSAALTAAEGGARVMVFEKERSLGGTSNFSHGTFADPAFTPVGWT